MQRSIPGILFQALAYTELGYRVIPVVPGGKRPIPLWSHTGSTMPRATARWLSFGGVFVPAVGWPWCRLGRFWF
jgi:hypothetical protein